MKSFFIHVLCALSRCRDVQFYDDNNNCQDYQIYPRARYVSEFGFQSWPSAASLRDVSSKED